MKRLSIIVPIYNVEPYVERCLRSLEDQDIPKNDYEIICINDGSPDSSRDVVEHLQSEFNNIVLVDQENQGVSRARNNGIDKSGGRYIMFIDPDDYVDSNCLGRILSNANNQRIEVSFLGYTILKEGGAVSYRAFETFKTERLFTGIEAYRLTRGDGRTDPDRMWAILFKTEFINHNNLRYLPDVPYLEDGEFIARILCLAKSCAFDSHSFYQRTTRPGSATNSSLASSEKATNGFLLAAVNLKKFQQSQDLNDKQKEFLNQPIAKFILLAVNSSVGLSSFKRLLRIMISLKDLSLRKIEIRGFNRPEYFIYGKMYNISPWLGALAMIVYPRVERLFFKISPGKINKELV